MSDYRKRIKLTNIRAYPDTNMKLKELCLDVSQAQREPVKVPELVRRAFNIPNIKEILISDARTKAALKKR